MPRKLRSIQILLRIPACPLCHAQMSPDLAHALDFPELEPQKLHERAVLAMTELVAVADRGLPDAEALGDVRLRDRARASVRVRVAAQIGTNGWKQDFEKSPEGSSPGGWVNANGKFTVVKLPDGNMALMKNNNDPRPPLADQPVSLGTHNVVVKTATGETRRFGTTVTAEPVRIEVDFSKP